MSGVHINKEYMNILSLFVFVPWLQICERTVFSTSGYFYEISMLEFTLLGDLCMDILLEFVDSLYDLVISIFNWMDKHSTIADWLSSIATAIATVTALYLSKKEPQKIHFNLAEGRVFNSDFDYSRVSIQNFKSKFRDKTVTLHWLNVAMLNADMFDVVVVESGIIVKGSFKKQILNKDSVFTVRANSREFINFGNMSGSGLGHLVSLSSYSLNPFITGRSVTFKVYVKDSVGRIYKSKYYHLDMF